MSGIAAVLDLHGAQPDPEALKPVLRVLERRGPDGTSTRGVGPVVLGCARLDTLPEDGPQPVSLNDVTVVADARLDNRSELERRLHLPCTVSDVELIAGAVARWGAAAPERLEGDYAVLAWDGDRLFAFRDRFGVRPLFYINTGRLLYAASEIHALSALQTVAARPDQHYFLEQLAAQATSGSRTPFEGIGRLPSGSVLGAAPGRVLRIRRYYWLAAQKTTKGLSFGEAAEATRSLLDEAVRVRFRARGPVACDVSGGMDSTSIYATARCQGMTPHALSIVSDRWPTMDERSYSQPLVGGAPWTWVFAEHHVPVVEAEAASPAFDEPTQDVLFSVRLAAHQALPSGCRVVLSGHGGDGTMSGTQGHLHALARQGRWPELYREARLWADMRDVPLARAASRALRSWRLVAPRLPWASASVAREARVAAMQLTASIRDVAGPTPEAAAFHAFTETGLRQQPRDPVETRYPFLHRALVEFALSTPSYLKSGAGLDKRVLRQAMNERLPAVILERVLKTGYTAAYSYGLTAHWRAVDAWLSASWLCELGILEARGFRQLVERLRDGQGGQDADTIYALADEAWLRSHNSGSTVPDPLQPTRRGEAGVRRSLAWRRVEGR